MSYSLDDDAGGRFSIDAAGVVRVAGALDRESAASHDVTVRATSTDGSFSTATFTIAIDDVDEFDVGAVTDGNAAANTVAENALIGTAVGISVVATDPDATVNAVTWTLDDDAGGRFSIDAGGVVRIANALDFETASSHSVIVRATSDDGSFSTATFGITVTDVSEAAVGPISDTDGADDRVSESAAIGTAVGIAALAVDPDVVDTVSYSLDDDAGGRFAIDAAGVVRVAGALDRESAASHDVVVRATSTDGSFSTATFTIAIDDVDEFDVGAITDGDGATNTVAESAAIGTAVGISALATDLDATTNAITWSLDDDAGGLFSIDAGGVVRVAGALDFETDSSHSVIVRATSVDGSFSTATFGITVTDVSEASIGATSDNDAAEDRVAENAAIGTAVGVTALAVDPDVVDTVSYSLDDDAGGRFSIDAAGVVRVAGGLDREAATSHDVTVRATSTDGSFSTATFTIAVDDIDEFDVGPVTDGNAAADTVAESAAIGTAVGISALATDLDATTSAITWSLDDDAGGRFSIDAGGVVRVASALDFETASSHSVIVRATSDDGSFSTATFGITVTDTSEAAVGPLSDTDGADDRVNENAIVGTAVGVSVLAVDPDIVDTVAYSLDDDAGGRFSIDAAGVVRVAGALDRESAASHDVIVRATSTDGSFSTAAFTIAIDDVDEFDVGAVTDGNAAANTVAENAAIGTAVGISALATDPDATTSALTWSLDDDAGGRFSIDAGGVIRVADLLDYETAASHAVIVRATSDDGSFSTATFDIAVTDVSESAVGPVADTDAAPDHVSEDAAIGTLVGITASAVDPDVLDSVTYTLDNDAGGRFSIDAAGVVRVAGALDREAAGSHEIVVRATSTDGTFSARIFTVAVDDVDEFDVGPVTDTNAAPNTVAESATTGSAVGITAGATDPDATTNGITWSLDNDAGGRFTIDGNGVVRVGNGLDYESATSHGIVVRATSADGSTSTQAFTIQVTDTNESGVGGISDVNGAANRVTENVGAGTAVGITASARDPDKSDSVSFSLENSAGNRFVIDAATGVVRTARLIDREVAASFDIVVRATSTDGSFSRQTFTIDVTDVDEHDVGAVFDANGADDTVPENALVGTTVGITARAVDADATNSGVRYTLVDNAGGRFSIDATSGVVRVAAKLDYETAPSHTIVVRATGDDGSTSTGSFVIAVADVGEYSTSPIQDANGAANAVQENAAIGTTVGITASAVDRDREDSVSYVLDDSAGGRFSIDADSGVVRVAGAIDREAVDALNIVVRAVSTDGSFTTRAFTIAVGGVNDNAPVITSGGGRALAWLSLEEGTTAATTMTAEDADVPASATPLTWSIIGGSDATAFTLDARSGELRLRAEPDFEHPADADGDNTYEVLVRVSDGTNTASQLLNVRIVDRNEPSVARDDTYATREDAALTVRAADGVLANDEDPDGGALSAVLVEGPAHGSVRLEADGSFTYTPSSEYAGRDSFSYRIRSGDTESNLAVVVIDVGAVDDAPVNIVPPAQTVTEDTALVFSGTGGNRISVSDPDAGDDLLRVRVAVDRGLISIDRIDGLTVESGDPAGDAALTLRGTESALDRALDGLRFTPLADWSGTARLTIVTAGVATDAPPAATDAVDITVRPANDAPVLDMPGRIVTAENERAILQVAAQDPDLPDERLRFSIDGGADAALFTVDAGSGALGWVDAPDYETPRDAQRANVYEVRVRVADDSGATDARTLRIEVTNVNEAPVVWATAGTDGGSAPIAAVAITDVDSGLITSATVRVANGAPADADQLMLTGAHAMQAYWNAADATLTLVGPASITQYEQALRAVMFETSDAAAPARLVTITVSDGALASPVSANAYAVGTALRASAPMLPLAPQPGSPATPDGTGLTGQPVGTTAGSTPSSTPYATTPTPVAGLTPVTPSLALPSTPSFTSPASITAPTTSTGTTPPGVTAPGTTPTGKALEAAAGATPSGTTGTTGATASPTAPARASTGLSPLTDALDALITASAPPAERLADPTRVTVLQGASTGLVSLRSDPAVLGGFALSQPLAEVLSLSLDTERTAAVAGLDLLLGMPGGGTGRTTVTVAADGLRIELTGSDAISVDALSTTTRVSGLAASALTLWWAARATGLAAALAASVPAWSSFDPLPIVDRPDAPRKGKAATRRPAPAGAAPAGAASAGAAAPTTTQTQTVQATPRTLLIMDDAR
ncbi:MAG TPA: cadherin domain-containing protein [Quisquiliibacterium sp.]|nr:cadherin domain-containing protein [Quisquiliibacterium sp.]